MNNRESRASSVRDRQHGFSLLELMIVLLVLSVMMGTVFQQINLVQQRNAAEQSKIDIFEESRSFVDQLTRDLHLAGYPNPRNFAPGYISGPNDQHAAVGLVRVAVDQLWFEGDVDGDGAVDSVQFYLESSGSNCPCLKRSQTVKLSGSPLTGQGTATYQAEVQNVQNGTSSNPIFQAYDINGNLVTLPVDFNSNANTIASIRSIKVTITVQSPIMDFKTRTYPITTLVSSVDLDNCSQAAASQTMSCQ
jgi:prepilin-type N-terminal cleavage/methylation domain-containing protein